VTELLFFQKIMIFVISMIFWKTRHFDSYDKNEQEGKVNELQAHF